MKSIVIIFLFVLVCLTNSQKHEINLINNKTIIFEKKAKHLLINYPTQSQINLVYFSYEKDYLSFIIYKDIEGHEQLSYKLIVDLNTNCETITNTLTFLGKYKDLDIVIHSENEILIISTSESCYHNDEFRESLSLGDIEINSNIV